jgi:hypothetical protein
MNSTRRNELLAMSEIERIEGLLAGYPALVESLRAEAHIVDVGGRTLFDAFAVEVIVQLLVDVDEDILELLEREEQRGALAQSLLERQEQERAFAQGLLKEGDK